MKKAPRKLRAPKPGEPLPEITKLKNLWPKLSAEDRADWLELFGSPTSREEIRGLLLSKLNVNLEHDGQVGRFREWAEEQEPRYQEAQAVQDDIRDLEAQGLTGEQLRDELLKRMKARALNTGNFELGLKAIAQDVKVESLALDHRKLALLEKKAAADDLVQAALVDAKNSKGGITPETLKKIETELKLL